VKIRIAESIGLDILVLCVVALSIKYLQVYYEVIGGVSGFMLLWLILAIVFYSVMRHKRRLDLERNIRNITFSDLIRTSESIV
jgi:hypothetical protein